MGLYTESWNHLDLVWFIFPYFKFNSFISVKIFCIILAHISTLSWARWIHSTSSHIGFPHYISRKLGHFQKSLLKARDMWWEKGTHFKDRIIHRGAATHTNTSSLSPLHKTLLQMCIHYLLIWHQTEKKKLCICKAILNVVRKADCITHTSSGTLSLEVSHNLLLAITNICTVYLKNRTQNIIMMMM